MIRLKTKIFKLGVIEVTRKILMYVVVTRFQFYKFKH